MSFSFSSRGSLLSLDTETCQETLSKRLVVTWSIKLQLPGPYQELSRNLKSNKLPVLDIYNQLLISFQFHIEFRMTLQTVDFCFSMSRMTNRAADFAQMGFMRISVGEILGSRFGNQLLHRPMTGQTPGVFHRIPAENILTVTCPAGDALGKMAGKKKVRFQDGGEHLFQQGHIFRRKSPIRAGDSGKAEGLARFPGVTIQAIRFTRAFQMGKVEADLKFVRLGHAPSFRGMAFHADAQGITLDRGVGLRQDTCEIIVTDRAGRLPFHHLPLFRFSLRRFRVFKQGHAEDPDQQQEKQQRQPCILHTFLFIRR